MRVRFGQTGEQDEWLLSPALDLSEDKGISLQFWHWFQTLGEGVAQVRVSIDGGQSWSTMVEYSAQQFGEPVLLVPEADGQPDVRFCWRYLADLDHQWEVDDVRIMAEVPVDMAITGIEGPTAGDYVPSGRNLQIRVVFVNFGSQSSPPSLVVFSTSQGTYEASLPSGLAPDESTAVSFMIPSSLVAVSGDETLTVVVSAGDDAEATNDSLIVTPIRVSDEFNEPGLVLLNYDDVADSALFAPLLEGSSITYDCWNRRLGGSERNLYGLEAWRLVVFTENEIYPALAEQYSLMRGLDLATSDNKSGLVISGDNWLRFYSTGAVSATLVEQYLRLAGGAEYADPFPSLYPIPQNTLGLEQIMLTDAEYPDILSPNPDLPGAETCLTYDEGNQSGGLAVVQTENYAAIALGLEWKQLIRFDEQVYLAGACLDWLLTLGGMGPSGEAVPLPAFRIGTNPADDRLVLNLLSAGEEVFPTANLLDMGGMRAMRWELFPENGTELALPGFVRSGAYCLVLDDPHGDRWTGRVVVRR
jgi:hypothetical protein